MANKPAAVLVKMDKKSNGSPQSSLRATQRPSLSRFVPGPVCQAESPLAIDEGTMCRLPSAPPGPICDEVPWSADLPAGSSSGSFGPVQTARDAINNICNYIDEQPEIKGAGVVVQLPVGDPILVRESRHASGLETIVQITPQQPAVPDDRTFWQRWNGVILNCGGATISWIGVGVSALAEVPTAGGSSILLIATYSSATATSIQCGLAVAKESSDSFQQFVAGPNGKYFDAADVLLDIISLAGGIAGAIAAVKSGSTLLKTSKFAAELDSIPKGQVLKQLERLEKMEHDVAEFRQLLQRTLAHDAKTAGNVAGGSGGRLTNNVLKRALPLMTKRLRVDLVNGLASVISASMSTLSSSYGGSGPRGLGIVKWIIHIYQESIYH